jgi:hypothetical protein
VKQTIKVGGRDVELDLITAAEIATIAEGIVSGYLRPATPRRDEDGLVTPAAGDVTLSLPPVPRGMEVVYTRIVVESPGSTTITPGAPYNAAGAYLTLLRSGEVLDLISLVAAATVNAGAIPFRWTFSDSNAIRLRDGEALSCFIHVPPASTPLMLRADGFLSPIAGDVKPGSTLIPGD